MKPKFLGLTYAQARLLYRTLRSIDPRVEPHTLTAGGNPNMISVASSAAKASSPQIGPLMIRGSLGLHTGPAFMFEDGMRSPFNASGNFQTIAPFFVSDKERGLDITLADGPGGRMEDANGLGFHKAIEVRFSSKKIWIPCFTHNERYTLNFRGEERSSAYISMFSIPRDIAEVAFLNQFKFLFDRNPSSGEVQQFWSDIEASIKLFLEQDRSYYEENVANPSKPRFVLFDYGLATPDVGWTDLNWREIAARALTVMNASREA